MIKELKVLNVSQPFAHFIFHKGKNIENRSRGTTIRGTIAIYASKTKRKGNFKDQSEPVITEEDCSFGAIIGLVDIVDCITGFQVTDETRKWFNGPFGYVFANPRLLKTPINAEPPKGAVTWWTLTDDNLQKILNQIDKTQIISITNVEPSEHEVYVRMIQTKLHKPTGALIKLVGEEPLTMQDCLDELDDYIFDNKIKIDFETKSIVTDDLLREIFKKYQVPGSEVIDLFWEYLEELTCI